MRNRLHLHLGIAGTGGENAKAQSPRAVVEEKGARRHVIHQAIVESFARPAACGIEGPGETPGIGDGRLGLEDWAWRHEDPCWISAAKASKRRSTGLKLCQARFP